MLHPILGMASHDLSNAKPTFLRALPKRTAEIVLRASRHWGPDNFRAASNMNFSLYFSLKSLRIRCWLFSDLYASGAENLFEGFSDFRAKSPNDLRTPPPRPDSHLILT